MALAIQNLAWGIGQPIFGAIAEKFGDRRAIIIGALMYSAGLGITTTSALGAAAISVIGLANIAGSITAAWLGGKMYDISGDYTAVWWIGIGVGAFSALVHLPIRERPLQAQMA